MFIVAKTIKGKEYIYSNKYSILCKNEKEAQMLSKHLNDNNNTAIDTFKLKESECWHVYQIDEYDTQPTYKLKNTKGKITLVYN